MTVEVQQANLYNRSRCVNEAIPVIQKIATITHAQYPYTAGQASVINLPLLNVGLIKRLWIRINANIQQTGAETHTRTEMGPSNFLSQVVLTDLNNLVRINTSGWHLTMLSTARRALAFGAAFTSDSPTGVGSKYSLITAPTPVTAAANLNMFYELPLAYSDNDLRGAIFANVVNATMNLQLTINPNFFVANTANATQACYQSSTAVLGKINTYSIEVYQEYLDQLPRGDNGGFALPMLDLNTQYNLLSTTSTGLAVSTDFSLPYANFRSYYSTFTLFDNGGTVNAGTDVNYFSLASANSMNILKFDPFTAQLLNGRNRINDDWPKGLYYFDHRAKPLSSMAVGNMSLNLNPSVVNANAQIVAGYEFMAFANQLASAGSINSN